MSNPRRLMVKGQGLDAQVVFYLRTYRGKVWITIYDCPHVCEAILETAQADSLVESINQTVREARGYRRGSGMDSEG